MSPDRRVLGWIRSLAKHTPPAAESDRALELTRSAILRISAQQRRRRWVHAAVPSAIAACVIAAVLLFVLGESHARASQQFRQATVTAQNYQGWIHLVTTPRQASTRGRALPTRIIYDSNASQGIVASVREYADDAQMTFRAVKDHVVETYSKKTGEIRRRVQSGDGDEGMSRDMMIPASIGRTLDSVKAAIGHDPASLRRTHEGGEDRFDVTLFGSREDEDSFRRKAASDVPASFSVWVNKDKTMTRLSFDTSAGPVATEISYGGPVITSIYDLGVPRDATVTEVHSGEHEEHKDHEGHDHD